MTAAANGDTQYQELKAALEGLSYQSESDYPLEFLCWAKPAGGVLDAAFVCQQLGLSNDSNVEEDDPQELLDRCALSDEGFKKLDQVLNGLCKSLKLFRIGEVEVTIVVLGENENNIIGFNTTSIET